MIIANEKQRESYPILKMTASQSHFSLSCDSYKQIIFSGFTRLQEQQEFVDLTLAADGYIVKVHKNIMALASPYIKELLKSTSSDNPVIFLNNVNHNVLKYLLEYIYQGEVNLPQDSIESFLQLSQSLHITGMAKPSNSKNVLPKDHASQNLRATITKKPVQTLTIDGTCNDNESSNNVAARITINNDHNFEVQQFDNVQNIQISNVESNNHSSMKNDDSQIVLNADTIQAMPIIETFGNGLENPGNMEVDFTSQGDNTNSLVGKKLTSLVPTIQILSDSNVCVEEGLIDLSKPINLDKEAKDALKILSQYTVTERGSVQIIVSRFIYCSHHSSRGGRKHRWRCSDYRKNQCPAYIDSLDDRIISRKGVHNHAFHDDKIYKKHMSGNIYTSYKQAKESWLPKNKCSDVESDDLV